MLCNNRSDYTFSHFSNVVLNLVTKPLCKKQSEPHLPEFKKFCLFLTFLSTIKPFSMNVISCSLVLKNNIWQEPVDQVIGGEDSYTVMVTTTFLTARTNFKIERMYLQV